MGISSGANRTNLSFGEECTTSGVVTPGQIRSTWPVASSGADASQGQTEAIRMCTGRPPDPNHMPCMCGRYASFLPPSPRAAIRHGEPAAEPRADLEYGADRDAPVVRLSRDGERHLDALKWGLIPYFTKDLKKARKPINARSETVAKSGMFREAFAKRRCLVPAPATTSGVTTRGQDAICGRARGWQARRVRRDLGGVEIARGERLQTFATITTDANESAGAGSRTACR